MDSLDVSPKRYLLTRACSVSDLIQNALIHHLTILNHKHGYGSRDRCGTNKSTKPDVLSEIWILYNSSTHTSTVSDFRETIRRCETVFKNIMFGVSR